MAIKTIRQPLRNAIAQNDVDMEQFSVLDALAVENLQSKTVYVDPNMPTEIGVISTGVPFKTIDAALVAIRLEIHMDRAHDNYTIILRPGVYAFDGVLTLDIAGLAIIGDGAVITPLTAGINEAGKFLITAPNTTIDFIEFDGLVDTPDDSGPPTQGAIEVSSAVNVVVRNCNIHDWAGVGIHFINNCGGALVYDNLVDSCYAGVTSTVDDSSTVNGIIVRGNSITRNRGGGIELGGGGANTHQLINPRITDNDIVGNNASTLGKAAIRMDNYCRGAIISGNYISGGYDGIYLKQTLQAVISGNMMFHLTQTGVTLDGCQQVNFNGNLINGVNDSDVATTSFGVYIIGNYHVAGDAGPYIIANNGFWNFTAAGAMAIEMDAATSNVSIVGNRFTGGISATDFTGLLIGDNSFALSSTALPILLESLTLAASNATIISNKFIVGTPAGIIRVIDPNAHGVNSISIISNSSNAGKTYSDGTYKVLSGSASNVYISANQPPSTTFSSGAFQPTSGWVNDGLTQTTSAKFVAQSGGSGYFYGAAQVVGARVTGFAADTGTADKTAHATYTAVTISNPPTQAEVQAISTALQNVSRGQKALKDAAIAHGLVGT